MKSRELHSNKEQSPEWGGGFSSLINKDRKKGKRSLMPGSLALGLIAHLHALAVWCRPAGLKHPLAFLIIPSPQHLTFLHQGDQDTGSLYSLLALPSSLVFLVCWHSRQGVTGAPTQAHCPETLLNHNCLRSDSSQQFLFKGFLRQSIRSGTGLLLTLQHPVLPDAHSAS